MAFSDTVKAQAFKRSGGRCECRRKSHKHILGRCLAVLLTRSAGEFHHVTAASQGGSDGLSNCEVLCRSCHKNTTSYGR